MRKLVAHIFLIYISDEEEDYDLYSYVKRPKEKGYKSMGKQSLSEMKSIYLHIYFSSLKTG